MEDEISYQNQMKMMIVENLILILSLFTFPTSPQTVCVFSVCVTYRTSIIICQSTVFIG